MKTYSDDYLDAAHKHSSNHKKEIIQSTQCGCFYCVETYPPTQIKQWSDKGETAICPHCSIDSVIGSISGYPVTELQFLKAMYNRYFESMDNEHGISTMKVYPINESQMRAIKANSKNASIQSQTAAASFAVVAGIATDYAFSGTPTPFAEAIFWVGSIVGLFVCWRFYKSAVLLEKTASDEWAEVEKNTKFLFVK